MKEAVEYIHEEYCDKGKRRKLFGVGISLGSGILANYMGKEKQNCRFDAAFGLGCHYDTHKGMAYVKQSLFGFYDYVLGIGCRLICKPFFA